MVYVIPHNIIVKTFNLEASGCIAWISRYACFGPVVKQVVWGLTKVTKKANLKDAYTLKARFWYYGYER